ncbi:MAG: hypothetical protein J6L62_06445 [Clostridia bacterium]|nr:hypothetical protein [Clostridia bacterium]
MNIIEQENLLRKRKTHDIKYMFKHPDEWGYFTNLHHPTVREEFELFRKERQIPYFAPLSDDERHEFDCMVANKYKKEWKRWQSSFLKYIGGSHGRKSVIPEPFGPEESTADSA